MAKREFESLWKLGDFVSVIFPGNGEIKAAEVVKISFDRNNVLYDVQVGFRHYESEDLNVPSIGYTRIHGLKEWHLRNEIKEELILDEYKPDDPALFPDGEAKSSKY